MAQSDRVRYVSTFRAPTEYERQLEEARRRAALAEALAQQEYQPMEGTAAPIPKAAPLVKALQGYLTAREGRKAREAAEEAKGLEADYAQRMLGRMQGGYEYRPDAGLEQQMAKRPEETLDQYNQRIAVTPFVGQAAPIPDETAAILDEDKLKEVTRQSQYRRAPEEVLGMASTSLGTAALKDRPVMSARLAEMLKTPETKTMEFDNQLVNIQGGRATPVVDASGKPLSKPAKPKAATRSTDFGGFIREYYNDGTYQDVKKTLAPSGPRDEPLMSIVGPDGKPILARRSEAEGKQPFFATMANGTQLTGDDKVDRRQFRAKRQELQNAYNSVLGFVKELKNTPKEESLFGKEAGRLATNYKLALGAVRVLQNTGVLNVGELPFIEDTLRDPQSISQLFNPASRATISGQVESILDLLEQQSSVNDEIYGYDVTPLKGRELRGEKIPAAAVKAGLTQADWDAATEEEKAAWR
jgi:hypothetical protein